MDKEFHKAYGELNREQLKAVNKTDGPILVIAGPGTGKTQLLTTRVAHILKSTDTPANSILCLTFTESGADTMRRRLESMIGPAAYEVQISTYHAYGSELLRRYPEYIDNTDAEPIDELGRFDLLAGIIDKARYDLPLSSDRQTIKAVIGLISDAKQALLLPDDITAIAAANLAFLAKANASVPAILSNHKAISKKDVAMFAKLSKLLGKLSSNAKLPGKVELLARLCQEQLQLALDDFWSGGKTTELTAWKKAWLAKDSQDGWVLKGSYQQRRLTGFAEIYRAYQDALVSERLFDYDDMIIKSIDALDANSDFKYTVAEQYLYIMLDEFQDTNLAQLRLVELLTDSPVHEGSPNIMAVGDDDQAIYAFQGAHYSNMKSFRDMYKEVEVICLTENYRSHADILHLAASIAKQIDGRLVDSLGGVSKELIAVGKAVKEPVALQRIDFLEPGAQYAWVAKTIAALRLKSPELKIGVMAPKHRHIEPLIGQLAALEVPMRYERREHIFDEPSVQQLLTMAKLVVALHKGDIELADSLWPEILSYDFWKLKTSDIWRLSWQAKDRHANLSQVVMEDKLTQEIGDFFGRLANLHDQTTMEQQLDALTGYNGDQPAELRLPMLSPYYGFYFGPGRQPADYLQVLSQLTVLRSALRDRQRAIEQALKLEDLVKLAAAYERADIRLLNTSPLRQADNAVELMTTYRAKGQEFDAVFMLNVQDEAWGPLSKGQSDRIGLPANLAQIRYQGDSDDERLRLLFVAVTRAKSQLYMTNFNYNDNGKASHRLRYLSETEEEDGTVLSPLLPKADQRVIIQRDTSQPVATAQHHWQSRHSPPFVPKLGSLLSDRLERFMLSPTHLNAFTDLKFAGPRAFFMNTILAFPQGPTNDGQFGNAVHETMQWYGQQVQDDQNPGLKELLGYFDNHMRSKHLGDQDTAKLIARGHNALTGYFAHHAKDLPKKGEQFEVRFGNDGVFSGPVHLNGVIDRLALDPKTKTITVIDYKTGAPSEKWDKSSIKHHKYIQQLLTYKLLVEGSPRFAGYKLGQAAISFIEPDEEGRILGNIWLEFDQAQLDAHKQLLSAVWKHVKALDFPDTDKYPQTLAGIKAFEQDLLK